MKTWRTLLGNERGVAVVLSLMMLLTLTGLLLAFLSVSALEPQISKNIADTARARYLAEAGIEVGYNLLINSGDATNSFAFSPALVGANASVPWVSLVSNGTLNGVTTGGATAEATFAGTYNVIVRNDYLASDANLTGVNPTTTGETVTADGNKIVIMRSTGNFNGATKTIEVVVRRGNTLLASMFPAAVNLPGVQTDTFINNSNFDIDGRDYRCTSSCDTASNWALTGTGTNPNKYGISSRTGTQSNINVGYEANIESAVSGSSGKLNDIKGRNQGGNGTSYNTGLNTIVSDDTLTPAILANYLDQVKSFAGTTVLQSTQACPMQLTGSTTPTNTVSLSNGCSGAAGVSRTLDLGTRSNPKLIYFRGDPDPSSQFTGLQLNNSIKGAGVLVIEDGDLKNLGDFTWDGVVIVTGQYVGAGFMSGSNTTIRGALVANETQPGEANGFFEFYLHGSLNTFSVHASKQNIDTAVQMRGNHTMTNWREL